jgi:O-methyltransferase involved in polyketide biosynthesis
MPRRLSLAAEKGADIRRRAMRGLADSYLRIRAKGVPIRRGGPAKVPGTLREERRRLLICIGVETFDTSRPNIARVYDYWLGGKDNFAADRDLAEKIYAINPLVAEMVRANRAFVVAAVTRAAQAGVTQFLDLGAGLPTHPSTDEAAREINPGARIAYVDNDPIVVSHARALLASRPGVAAAAADLTDAAAVLADPGVSQVIDPGRPVCVIMACVLHFFDATKAQAVTAAYLDCAAAGSWVATSVVHIASQRMQALPSSHYTAGTFINHGERDMVGWLAGWDMITPGIGEAHRWVSGIGGTPSSADSYVLCAAASKPRSR